LTALRDPLPILSAFDRPFFTIYKETVCHPNTLKHICSGRACPTIATVVEVCRAVKSEKVVRMDENSRPGSVGGGKRGEDFLIHKNISPFEYVRTVRHSYNRGACILAPVDCHETVEA
jgi:hypothetical protein